MRFLVFILVFFGCYSAFGQKANYLSAGIEKNYYLDTNSFFQNKSWSQINDSVNRLRINASGDLEFQLSINLFSILHQYRDKLISRDSAVNSLRALITNIEGKNLNRLEADAHEALGDMYINNSTELSAATEQFLASYEIYRNFTVENYPAKHRNTYKLGLLFYRYQEYEQSLKYLKEALVLDSNAKFILNTIGMCFRQMAKYDSAIFYFQKLNDYAIKHNQNDWIGISQGNIGITYFYLKKYNEAIPLLKTDISNSIATRNIRNAVFSMRILGEIYYEHKKYDEAEKLLLSALNYSHPKTFWNDYSLAHMLYTQLFKVYKVKNEYKLSSSYADSALIAMDSFISNNNAMLLARSVEKQNFIRKKLLDEKLQNEAKLNKIVTDKHQMNQQETLYKFIIGFLIVVIFVAIIMNRFGANLRNISTNKSDAPEVVLQKMSIVIISIATCAAAVVWAILYYYYYGIRISTCGPILYFFIIGPALIHYFYNKQEKYLINVQLFSIFMMPVIMELSSGGFQGGIVIFWAFLAPVGALMYKGKNEAAFWMILLMVAILCTIVFNKYLSAYYFPISQTAQAMFDGMNLLGPIIIIYFSMQYFVKSVISNRLLLQKNNLVLSNTMDELKLEKQRAENAYLVLKETHSKLIQSEKMAVLGQLAAGIAHEVNTPLGAIKSSAEESEHAFSEVLSDLIWLTTSLNETERDMFVAFISSAKTGRETFSTKEEREIKKAMRARFIDLGINNPHFLSDRLVQVGIYEVSIGLEQLSKLEHFEKLVMLIYNILNQKRSNKTIQIAVEKASRIVKALKTYAHTSHNDEMESINLCDNMETVLTIYSNKLKIGITVIKNYDDVPEILGYADQLNQVWTNLIINAVQAMDNKGILTIGIKNDGDYINVSIKDTGKGIPKEIQDKIFTPFFTTKGSGEGSGLGLDIICRILKEHNSLISFETTEGEGTTFYVKIPKTKTNN